MDKVVRSIRRIRFRDVFFVTIPIIIVVAILMFSSVSEFCDLALRMGRADYRKYGIRGFLRENARGFFEFFGFERKTVPVVAINEFMADNKTAIEDPDERGKFPDWIELYNKSDTDIDVGGMFLTDDFSRPTKHRIPDSITIKAGGYLVFWADNEPWQGLHHTSFKLKNTGGQIGLYDTDGATPVDIYTYQAQSNDVSEGRRVPDGQEGWLFFISPTPGGANLAPVSISPGTGSYHGTVTVVLKTDIPGALIYYAYGGWDPKGYQYPYVWGRDPAYCCWRYDRKDPPGPGVFVYTAPFEIPETRSIIARAYIPATDAWGEPAMATFLINEKSDLPVLALMTREPGGLWNSNAIAPIPCDEGPGPPRCPGGGIYHNPCGRGDVWERPAELAFFPSLGEGVDSYLVGLRIHGGSTRDWAARKSFRVYFNTDTPFNYPFFPGNPVESFRRMVIHAQSLDSWPGNPRKPYLGASFMRNQIALDLCREAGLNSPYSRYILLFIDGTDWGIYNFVERVNRYYLESHFDHKANVPWYLIDVYELEVVDGPVAKVGGQEALDDWKSTKEWWQTHDLSEPVNYARLQTMIDIDSMTRFVSSMCYINNVDWYTNFYVARRKEGHDTRWFWIPWDNDFCLRIQNNSAFEGFFKEGIWDLPFHQLVKNAEYRIYFLQELKNLMENICPPKKLVEWVDAWEKSLEAEMGRNARAVIDTFNPGWTPTVDLWKRELDKLRHYIIDRPAQLKDGAGGLAESFADYDADGDGLSDYEEVFIYETDPNRPNAKPGG